jgi:hypothetical protein
VTLQQPHLDQLDARARESGWQVSRQHDYFAIHPIDVRTGRVYRRESLDDTVALITATDSWSWWALELDGGSVTYDRDSLIVVGNDAESFCVRGWPGMPGGSRGPSHTFEQGAHTLYLRSEDRPDLPGNWYRWG